MARPKGTTQETADRIRHLYFKNDRTQQQLAQEFGLSQSTICKIVNNYIHKEINVRVSGSAEVRVSYGN